MYVGVCCHNNVGPRPLVYRLKFAEILIVTALTEDNKLQMYPLGDKCTYFHYTLPKFKLYEDCFTQGRITALCSGGPSIYRGEGPKWQGAPKGAWYIRFHNRLLLIILYIQASVRSPITLTITATCCNLFALL